MNRVQLRFARRAVLASLLGITMAMIPAIAAWAKIPYFSLELSPERPEPGQTTRIVVRFWEEAGHTKPATWLDENVPVLNDLIRAYPAGSYRRFSGGFPITLYHDTPATYEGEFTFPEAGSWLLVTFPGMARDSLPDGYPDIIEVEVLSPTGQEPVAPREGTAPAPGKALEVRGAGSLIPTTLGVAVLLGGLGFLLRRRTLARLSERAMPRAAPRRE
ncbi:MAG: hypothetical protein ACRDGU_04625 [Actinomycetota bacterium]